MLTAYGRLCEPSADLAVYDGIGRLPHFNPDDDDDLPPPSISEFRRLVAESDALVISSPEYAHGLPGSFKNALDWLVSDPRFPGKLAVIVSADRGTSWATDSLREILRTMSAEVLEDASIKLPLGSNRLEADQILERDGTAGPLRRSVDCLIRTCQSRRISGPGSRAKEAR